MDKFEAFEAAARRGGFIEAEGSEAGALWLKKPTADAEDRIRIDTVTNSATVYWATIPWKINSRTFRDASALQTWILSRPGFSAS
jgi:hypothetical protein